VACGKPIAIVMVISQGVFVTAWYVMQIDGNHTLIAKQ